MLVVGSADPHTGFGRVCHEIASGLHRHVEVHQLGLDLRHDYAREGWPVHANPVRVDRFGELELRRLVGALSPLVLLVDDVANLDRYVGLLAGLSGRPGRLPLVAYCAVDGDIAHPALLRSAARAARLVAYTQSGQRRLVDAWARLPADARGGSGRLVVDVIGHGVDHALGPGEGPDHGSDRVSRAANARRALGWRLPDDAFVILNVSRNQRRKRLDLTLEAFAIFAAQTTPSGPPPFLYLHCTGRTVVGPDVRAVARRLGIADRLLAPAADDAGQERAEIDMDLLYAACDVGINTALGESWNLATFEHARTGAPQVIVRTPTTEELWGDAAVLVPGGPAPLGMLFTGTQVEPQLVARALLDLHADPFQWANMSGRAAARAGLPAYGWGAVAERWRRLVDETLADPGLAWSM